MDDAQRPPLDSETILRGLHAKKRSAMRKMSVGRSIQKHGADLEREGAAELADAEAFERVLRSLPTTPEDIAALESAMPEQAMRASIELRNLMAHSDLKSGNVIFNTAGGPGINSRTQRDQVLANAAQMLSNGGWMSTEDLLEGLMRRGVQLTANNPLQRVSQILSMHPQFKNQRGRGWALRTLDDSPGPDSLSSERRDDRSDDEENDPLRVQARRVVIRDDNSAR